ncbi:hypothetical protein V7159_24495, partial [Priestia megaterium]
ALIPTVMDMSSVIASMRTIQLIQQLQEQNIDIQYSVLPHAVDFSKGFGRELKEVEAEFKKDGDIHFNTAIRYSAVIMRASLRGEVMNPDNEYMQKVMSDYEVVAKEIDEIMEHGHILPKPEPVLEGEVK